MATKKTKRLSWSEWWKQIQAKAESDVGEASVSVSSPAGRSAKKKALLIGINRYKVPGADLRGCVNDVTNIETAIKKHCGFKSTDIRKLTDFQATTANMRTEIARLVAGAASGDVLFLHYSGHGSNVPDESGDEADNRDEILCPTDLDWYDTLLDDWLRATFESVPKGVNLTVLFDCCHSGTATRAFHPPDAPVISRYLPCPLDLLATESGRSLGGNVRGRGARLRKSAKSRGAVSRNASEVSTPEVLIGGCRDDQTSADAYIKGSYNGALTYNVVAALKAKRGNVTYRQLHADAVRRVKSGGYAQVPQLSGKAANLDKKFLEPYA